MPADSKPRESKRAATRARLVEAARDALIDGNGDFEMSQLAQRAGVSSGLAYHHFGSKAGILAAVIDDFYDRVFAVLQMDVDANAPWADRELQRFRAWVAFLYEEPIARIVFGKMGKTVEVVEVEARRHDELIGFAQLNIEVGQQSGEIPESIDTAIAAAAIIGALRQTTTQAFSQEKAPEASYAANQLWAFISGALGLNDSH
ncbi:MAG: TetR/AcrR family transcriptional regulator [Myxococcota bacterium]